MNIIPKKIGQSVFVYIFINPLRNATGLYWIRIVIPTLTHQGTASEKKGGRGRVSWSADTAKLADYPLVSLKNVIIFFSFYILIKINYF